MNIQRRHLIYLFIAIVDMALTLCSYFLASFLYLGDPLVPDQLVNIRVLSWRDSGILFLIVYSFLLVLGYASTRVFGSIYFGQIRNMAKSVLLVNFIGLVLFMSSFYVFNLDDASRILVLSFFVLSTFSVCVANWAAIHWFRLQRNSKKHTRNVLVVGGGHLAREYAEAVGTRSSRFEHVTGYITTSFNSPAYRHWPSAEQNRIAAQNVGFAHTMAPRDFGSASQYGVEPEAEGAEQRDYLGPCLGTIFDLDLIFQSFEIDEIVLALDVEDYACVRQAVSAADRHGVSLSLVPFYNDIIPRKPNIESFGGVNVVDLRSMPLSNPVYELLKRASDIVVSLFVIIITSWLMAITAIGVKLSSPGPVFFRQERLGKGNKTFEMLKFRSMKVNESSDIAWSTNEDPRKTRFGSFIRKYSIDELPQFFNVLKGDMSIVGPRPEIPYYVQQFSASIPLYMLRHQVRPGITGLAQISGLRGDTSISERIELDIFYIQNWSFWLDVKIFFKTLFGGFVNDESLAESSIASKVASTKAGKLYWDAHNSAIEGTLGVVFNSLYLAVLFLYVFLTIYVNPVQEIFPGITPADADFIRRSAVWVLMGIGVFICICEGRNASFWILSALFFVVMNVIIGRSGYVDLAAIFAFVLAYPKNLKIENAAKAVFSASALAILLLVGCCVIGVIPDNIESRADLVRHSMGFINPGAFANGVTACLIPYVYFRLHNWRWTDVAFCILVGGITYFLALGRMAAVMLGILVVFACICRFDRVKGFLVRIAPWIVVGCFFFTLVICFMYWQGPETSFSNAMNHLLSDRLKYIASYFDDYSVKAFGQQIVTVGRYEVHLDPSKSWRGIDNSYINMLLRFGVVGCAMFLLPSIWLGYKTKDKKYTAAIFVITVVALFSVTENFFYNPIQNFGIFIMAYFVAAWSTKRLIDPEKASAPIVREIDWVNIKGSRWKDFLTED